MLPLCWPCTCCSCTLRPNGWPGAYVCVRVCVWNTNSTLKYHHILFHSCCIRCSRKPFQLRAPLFCYNLFMALLNAHICLELYTASRALNYSLQCQPYRVSYDPHEVRIATAFWWFYITKILEFADTLFFILRKKWSQLTFLHVYHHSSMFVICWIVVKWIPTGSTFVPALMNSFVHIIMYGYYSLSALGPRLYPYLWWKRYLTVLQLLQFALGLAWGAQALVYRCEYQPWLSFTGVAYMISFLFLFGRFYAQKYTKSIKECR
nr:elongation of very long chain fatty acids protein 4 isoform X1 [Drosophila virilis]